MFTSRSTTLESVALADLPTDVALEHDVLAGALPLVPISASGTFIALHQASGRFGVTLKVDAPSQGRVDRCIQLLRIRPLLFSIAWKIIDIFFEHMLREAKVKPDRRDGTYTIGYKSSKLASLDAARRGLLPADVWDALVSVYRAYIDIRHSLVHRTIVANSVGDLVGVSSSGAVTQVVLREHQEALIRVALRLCEAASQGPAVDTRTQEDLAAWLARIPASQLMSAPARPLRPIPWLIVTVDPVDGEYSLDVPRLWANPNLKDHEYVDLEVEFVGRPGPTAAGRLENAPREVVPLDPNALPTWLNWR